MKRQLAKGSFYLVAVGMFLFTAYMTLTFVGTVIPDAPLLVVLATLLVFDGGMLAWLVVFTSYAEGTTQRATAIVTCLFDFGGVGLMVAAEIVTAQSNIVTTLPLAAWATWAVALWTFVNVGAILLFHLSDPATKREMSAQSRRDKLTELASKIVDENLDDMALDLAKQIGKRDMADLLADMNLTDMTAKPAPMLRANAYTTEDTQPLPVVKRPEAMAAESPTSSPPTLPTEQADFMQASLM